MSDDGGIDALRELSVARKAIQATKGDLVAALNVCERCGYPLAATLLRREILEVPASLGAAGAVQAVAHLDQVIAGHFEGGL